MKPTLVDWNVVSSNKNRTKSEQGYSSDSLALMHVFMAAKFGLSPEEIQEAFTDGPKDRGIDAVYVEDGAQGPVIHFLNAKCVEVFERSSKHFPSKEIDKILTFLRSLFQKEQSLEKTSNPLLFNQVKEIWDILREEATPEFVVHLVSNQALLTDEQRNRLLEGLREWRLFSIEEHGLAEMTTLLLEDKREQIDIQIPLVDQQLFERSDGDVRGLIATVEATKLIKVLRDPEDPDVIRKSMFDENVRVYLGRHNRINGRILESALADSNYEFWYLNNGITLTCNSMSYTPGMRAPILRLQNVQIVNGGQTCNALFEAAQENPHRVASALVLVRVYETRRPELNSKIAESTNSQTPIRSRDLRSNDTIQRKLEESFHNLGYFYERKANQNREESRDRRIDALSAAQAYVAYSLEEPAIAGKDRGRIYGDRYDSVFNDDLTAEKLLVALDVFKPISQMKRELQAAIRSDERYDPALLFLIDGAYHLLYATSHLANLRGIDPDDTNAVKALIPKAVKVLKLAVAEESSDPAFAYKRFFKSARAKRYIQKHASAFSSG